MKEIIRDFFISLLICVLAPTAFWYFEPNFNDVRLLSDYFFLSGVIFFVTGMAMALFVTSRLHYYRHLKKKWQGKEKDDAFDKAQIERRKKMWRGIVIAITGIIGFAVSGCIAAKIGYLI